MDTSSEPVARTDDQWRTRGTTTIRVERRDGEWRASQRGVDVTGRGESAALAAADYCQRLENSRE